MHLVEGSIYHVFNRGNNSQAIFFTPKNYPYFLKGIEHHLKPACYILAWCLMPTHFHLLIRANELSIPIIKDGGFERQVFSQGIKQLLSSYTKAINKQEGRTGSLFQQKTKAVCVADSQDYARIALHYIHQNPLKAGLVNKMEDWEHSSFRDYTDPKRASLCNRDLVIQLLDLNMERFYNDSYQTINFELNLV